MTDRYGWPGLEKNRPCRVWKSVAKTGAWSLQNPMLGLFSWLVDANRSFLRYNHAKACSLRPICALWSTAKHPPGPPPPNISRCSWPYVGVRFVVAILHPQDFPVGSRAYVLLRWPIDLGRVLAGGAPCHSPSIFGDRALLGLGLFFFYRNPKFLVENGPWVSNLAEYECG